MCSTGILLDSLEGIKTGVGHVESQTTEFVETLLAAFLNGAGADADVENELAKLSEGIRQLKEVIQLIETKIRLHTVDDDFQSVVKMEVEFSENEDSWDFEAPEDFKGSFHLNQPENQSTECGELIQPNDTRNDVSTRAERKDEIDDTKPPRKNSKPRLAESSKSIRTAAKLKRKKRKPAPSSMDSQGSISISSELLDCNRVSIAKDEKLKQLTKVTLKRLNEKDLSPSATNELLHPSDGKPQRRSAAVKAIQIFKTRSRDSENSGSCDEGLDTEEWNRDGASDSAAEEFNGEDISEPEFPKHKIRTGPKKLIKSVCPKCGIQSSRMKEHIRQHDDPEVFKYICSICSVHFVKEHHFQIHRKIHEDNALSCPECGKMYSTQHQHRLDAHINEIHNGVPSTVIETCPWCLEEKQFKSKGSFTFHKTSCLHVLGNPKAPDGGPWKCPKEECSQQIPYSDFESFHIHMQNGIHPTSRGQQNIAVKCPVCNIEVKSVKNLAIHIKKHQPNKKLFKCSKCNKTFNYLRTLKRHERVMHSTERPFLCTKCPSTFRWKESLQTHLKSIHPSEEKIEVHICDQCGHTFGNKNYLQRHINHVHLDVRAYSCTLCDKKFKVKGHLNYHLNTHNNPKSKKRSLNKPRRVPVYRSGTHDKRKQKDYVGFDVPPPSRETAKIQLLSQEVKPS